MWLLIKEMFADFNKNIEAREISASYCPGSYDLSIDGKKFAGISQRRLKKGVAVQIYLCVTGSGSQRAELIREFYAHSKKGELTKFIYPTVQPEVMASLSELFGVEMTIQDVMLRFLKFLNASSNELVSGYLDSHEIELFDHYYNRVIERNERFLEPQE
jgi:octanoyl-[GcvH]:protein N-octanoyltransferase